MAKDNDTKTAQETPEAEAPVEEKAAAKKETKGAKKDSKAKAKPKATPKPKAKAKAKAKPKAKAKAKGDEGKKDEAKAPKKDEAKAPKKDEKKAPEKAAEAKSTTKSTTKSTAKAAAKATTKSVDPLPEDKAAAKPKATAKTTAKATPKPAVDKPRERPRDIPYRSRHPEPEMARGGGPWRLIITILVFLALVFLILSFANSRSFRIVNTGDTATLMRGTFLPWGEMEIVPPGGDAAFNPLPWVEPPAGAATRGSLRKVSDTYYAMLYLNAGEAQIDKMQFDTYEMQASALEVWFDERFGATPEAMDEFNELRSRVRARRKATEEYRDKREEVLLLIEDMLGTLPDRIPARLEADADRFRLFLEEVRASDER